MKIQDVEKSCDIVKLYNTLCEKAVVYLIITNGMVCLISFAIWIFVCLYIANSISQGVYFILSTIFMFNLMLIAKWSISRTYSKTILKYVSEEHQITEKQVRDIMENQESLVIEEK